MIKDRSLETLLDDDGFAALIEERLGELETIDPDDPEFIALWTAADFRLKHYHSLNGKEEASKRIMDSFRSRGFIPQFDICGPPTILANNIAMAPKGDLCYSFKWNPYGHHCLYVIASGSLLPLALFEIGIIDSMAPSISFSYDSRYVAISTGKYLTIWDVFGLDLLWTSDEGNWDAASWSRDSSRIACKCRDAVKVLDTATWNTMYEIECNEWDSAFLDEHGDKLLILGDESRIIDIANNSETRLDVRCITKNPLVHFRDGAFLVFDNGCLHKMTRNGCEVLRDVSTTVDVTNVAKKRLVPIFPEYRNNKNWQHSIVLNGTIATVTSVTNDGFIQNRIDVKTLKFSCRKVPTFQDEYKLPDAHPLSKEIIQKCRQNIPFSQTKMIDDGGAFYRVMDDGRIVALKLLKDGKSRRVYLFRIYNTNAGRSHYSYYVNPEMMAGLDIKLDMPSDATEYEGDDHDCIKCLVDKLDLDVTLIQATEPVDANLDLEFDPQNFSYLETCYWRTVQLDGKAIEVCIGIHPMLAIVDGKLVTITTPDDASVTADPLYMVTDDGLYKADLERRSFSKISEEGLDRKIEWRIEEHGNLILAHGAHTSDAVLLWKGRIIRRLNTAAITVVNGMILKIDDGDIVLETVDGSKEFLRIGIDQTSKWLPVGMDHKGTVSLIKKEPDNPNNILFARMSYPDYEIDAFDSCILARDIDDRRFMTDFRGTRAVSISGEDSFVRPIRMTSFVLKKEGLRRGADLIPDISRYEAYVVPMDGSRYILAAQGTFDDKDGIEKGIRPVMRLMDGDSGTMERKTTDRTEGQLYGLKGYNLVKIAPAPDSLNNGRIVAEFLNGTDRAIQTIDRNNNHFPAGGGSISGTILETGSEGIFIGLLKNNEPYGEVESCQEFDADMKPVSEPIPLNCRIHMNGRPGYDFKPDGFELDSFEYEGKTFDMAYFTNNISRLITGHRYSIDDHIPLIIELETSDCPGHEYPRPTSKWGDSETVMKKILLCTLHRGMIRNTVSIDIPVAQLENEITGDYHSLRLFYGNGSYRIEQQMTYDLLDTDGLYQVTIVRTDGTKKVIKRQAEDDLCTESPDDMYNDDHSEKYIKVGNLKIVQFQGVLGLSKN